MELLGVVGVDHHEDRVGAARGHFFRDGAERCAGATVFRLERARVGLDPEAAQRGKGEHGEPAQEEKRQAEHGARALVNEIDEAARDARHPIVLRRLLSPAKKHKKERHHEQRSQADAECDEHAELREAARAAQEENQKARGCGESAEENAFRELIDRRGDGLLLGESGAAARLVAAVKEHAEIDAEPDEDRAAADGDAVELAENERSEGDGDERADREHADKGEQGTEAAKSQIKDHRDQNDRASRGDDDVALHSRGHLGHIRQLAGDHDSRRAASPTGGCALHKLLDALHESLRGFWRKVALIGDREHESQRPVRGGERLRLLGVERARERSQRGPDDAKRIEIEQHLGPRGSSGEVLPELGDALLDLPGLKAADCFVELR